MPYTDDPANSVTDRIRLSVGDTDSYEEDLSDAIYQYLVDTTTSEFAATLAALRYLVAKYARYVTEKAGGLFSKESEKYDHYKDLLELMSKDPSAGGFKAGTGYAGGISITEVVDNFNNPDVNQNPISGIILSNRNYDSYSPKSFR